MLTPEEQVMIREEIPYEIKKGYVLKKCFGEAHSNGYIDNCPVCMPFIWGFYLSVNGSDIEVVRCVAEKCENSHGHENLE